MVKYLNVGLFSQNYENGFIFEMAKSAQICEISSSVICEMKNQPPSRADENFGHYSRILQILTSGHTPASQPGNPQSIELTRGHIDQFEGKRLKSVVKRVEESGKRVEESGNRVEESGQRVEASTGRQAMSPGVLPIGRKEVQEGDR